MTNKKTPLAITCPACDAIVGDSCERTPAGLPAYHVERWEVAGFTGLTLTWGGMSFDISKSGYGGCIVDTEAPAGFLRP